MECSNCARTVAPGDRFCNGCGSPLGEPGATRPVATTDADERVPTSDETAAASDTVAADTTASPIAASADAAPDSEPTPAAPPVPIDDTEAIPVSGTAPDPASTAGTEPTTVAPTAAANDETADQTNDETGDRTELIEIAPGDDWDDEPSWARTGTVPPTATDQLPATEPVTEVRMARVDAEPHDPATTPYDFAEREPVAITGQIDAQPAPTATMPAMVATAPAPIEPGSRFRFGLLTLIALVTGVATLGAMFADIIVITSDVRLTFTDDTPATFRTGTWIADDLADNLSVAGLIAVVLMVAGGVAGGFGWRWGSGLAGGAGLATAGLAALTIGLAQFPIDVARQFAAIPSETPFVLTITRDLGYWLLVVGGALGIVLFFASINDAMGDRRAGLNPWIAALGALAVVVAVAGPLINENQALFSDNWYVVDAPGEPSALLLVARLVQLGLFLIGGVIGFLSVRRWGLGVAIGATMPAVWLALSVLLELTDRPVGPGFRNPGAVDMHLHGVTIIGMSAVLAMIVLAVVGAYDQGGRERL